MSALVARQEPYRALQVFDTVPAGHTAIYVAHDKFAPHLSEGEFAVVDTNDKSYERGELYVYKLDCSRNGQIITGGGKQVIVQIARLTVGIWMRFAWFRRGGYVDGPLGFEHWPKKCVGRVVGVLIPEMVEP